MRNNLFDFATGELSQDAMICWCINWFNYTDKPCLKKMAEEILVNISGIENIKSVSIHRQYNKIDILLIINDDMPVIIEDKIFSSEHDNQINRYVAEIRKHVEEDGGLWIEGKKHTVDINKIRTVYWKTGYHYDSDKVVIADIVLDVDKVLALLEPYYNESEILSDYIDKLYEDKKWYEIHKKYWDYEGEETDSHWDLNISKHQIAQHTLMRDIFSEKLWNMQKGKYYENYQIYSGSSSGRPWTEMTICKGEFSDGSEYVVFWRIDTDSKAPYISLRLYEEGYDKNNKECKERHGLLWEKMRDAMKNILEKDDFGIEWVKVNPGKKFNCNEASVFHYRFEQGIRDTWLSNGEQVCRTIRKVNDEFCAWVNSELGEVVE